MNYESPRIEFEVNGKWTSIDASQKQALAQLACDPPCNSGPVGPCGF